MQSHFFQLSADDSDEGYTPLQRPAQTAIAPSAAIGLTASVGAATSSTKMEETIDDDDEDDDLIVSASSSDSDSDNGFKTQTKMSHLR